MTYEVKLDVFEGPLDLLLHLITRQRVDIYDVSLSTITDEYLTALAQMSELDLEVTTGFLVVAAALLELKSTRLLPGPLSDAGQESPLDERDLLLARLVECATFKEAGAWIGAELERGHRFYRRTAGLEPAYQTLAPNLLDRVAPLEIALAAVRALVTPKAHPQLDVTHLTAIQASVHDAIAAMSQRLMRQRRVTFQDLTSDRSSRLEVAVHFLAALELFKAGAVELSQVERFGDIELSWTGDVELAEVLDGVGEYAAHTSAG